MSPRDTRTGIVLEKMILPALEQGGYKFETQKVIGNRPNGRKHKIDVIASKEGEKEILISLKWQQVGGTAEQKVPFEVICLAEELINHSDKYKAAYLVLGGNGWTLRDYYVSGNLDKHLRNSHLINILTLETFISKSNRGLL